MEILLAILIVADILARVIEMAIVMENQRTYEKNMRTEERATDTHRRESTFWRERAQQLEKENKGIAEVAMRAMDGTADAYIFHGGNFHLAPKDWKKKLIDKPKEPTQ